MATNNFSEAVKHAMDKLNLTQTVIAKRSGYSVAYISDLLNGGRRWNEEAIQKVSQALGIEVSYEVRQVSEHVDGQLCETNDC